MERITKKDVESLFAHFLEVTNRKPARTYNDVGGYWIDYKGFYGGWVIERISNTGGGVSCPFGMRRLSTTEMYNALHFALNTAGEKR